MIQTVVDILYINLHSLQLTTHLIIVLLSIVILVYVLIKIIQPVNVCKDLRTNNCQDCALRKQADQLPNGFYPNGWIPIIETRKLRPNKVETVTVCGQEVVVFRGSSGQAHVTDAHCPHLGAHLGFGGRIVNVGNDKCLKCPFHGWTFRGTDGRCVDIPGCDGAIPAQAQLRIWPTYEVNGFVYVWYHCNGSDPTWYPPIIAEIESGQWVYRGRTEHLVNCFFQEIPENGADVAHFNELHKPSTLAGGDINKLADIYDVSSAILNYNMAGDWKPNPPPDQHLANVSLVLQKQFFNYPMFTMRYDITQVGPAIVNLRLRTFLRMFEGAFIQNVTPIGPRMHKIVHHLYLSPSIAGLLFSKFMLHGEATQVHRDSCIWNHKKFFRNPIFAKNDKSLAKFRRWFNQFYEEKVDRSEDKNDYERVRKNVDW